MNKQFFILILLGSAISQLGAEIISPSLPFINQEFSITASVSSLTISYYNLGMALPLIIFGIAADMFNRRKIMFIAAIIGLCGSLLCTIAPNIYTLILGRFIQAIGLSGVSGLTMTILRDKFSGIEFAKYLSYYSIAFSLTIDIAPFIGSILQHFFSFRVVFLIMLLLNLYILYLIVNYQDTYRADQNNNQTGNLANDFATIKDNTLRQIANIFSYRSFTLYTALSAIIYSIFMSYIVITTFVVQSVFHKSPLFYGIMVIALSCVFSLACLVNARLLSKIDINKLIVIGFIGCVFSGLLLVLTIAIPLNLVYFICAILPLFIGSAFIFPNVSSLTFAEIKNDIALASGVNSTIKFFAGFAITWLISLGSNHPAITLGFGLSILSIIALILLKNVANTGFPPTRE